VTILEQNIQAVNRLVNFDRTVLDYAIQTLKELRGKLKEHHKIDNPHLTAESALSQLRTIRENDSLRPQYGQIFNQCIVLLVSYFGSAISDHFSTAVTRSMETNPTDGLLQEDFRVSGRDLYLAASGDAGSVGDLVIKKKDISFQDMQSIRRSFKKYLGVVTDRDTSVHDIILGQAARHIIVHDASRMGPQFMRQIQGAVPRRIMEDLQETEEIVFEPDEIRQLGNSMLEFESAILCGLEKKGLV